MASSIDYRQARWLLLAVGFGVLLVTAVIMYVRRVETPEVIATLLFILIFVAFMFWDLKGGILAALIAAVIYFLARQPAIDAVGIGRFGGLIASRSFAFLAFGLLGGWANQQLKGSLVKLELYDQVDDETGLYNARFFVQDTDLEMSRAQRYQTIFSVSSIEIPESALGSMSRRQRRATLKDLGRMIQDALRTVDRASFAISDGILRLAVILPETAREGARIFTTRLVDRVAAHLNQRGGKVEPGEILTNEMTLPEDQGRLEHLAEIFKAIDRTEHPEASEAQES